jgi:hypothetical protein
MLAWRAISGGMLALLFGVLLQQFMREGTTDLTPYVVLLGGAALCNVLCMVLFGAIDEEATHVTRQERSPMIAFRDGVRLVRERADFRRYLVARCLLMTIELSIPFYALAAGEFADGGAGILGTLAVALGVTDLLSNAIWGRIVDRSSRRLMAIASRLAVGAGLVTLIFAAMPDGSRPALIYAGIFMLISFAESAVALSGETYLIDHAPDADRPVYLAMSNLIFGVFGLLAGVFGVIAQVAGMPVLIALFAALALISVWSIARLPERAQL